MGVPRAATLVGPTTELGDAWRDARAKWPGIDVDLDRFVAYVRERCDARTSSPHTDDLYLACACADGDPRGAVAFEDHCMSGLDRVLSRLGLAADAIAEVKQRVRFRVLVVDGRPGRITNYRGTGGLPAWVRVVAIHEAQHLARKFHREIANGDLEKLQMLVAPGEREHANAAYRRTFAEAFGRSLRALDPRDQVMLRQHFVDGMTIDELGKLHGVHRATAARTLERARRTLRAATKQHMREELDVGSAEVSSIIRIIRSRLELSLRGLRRRLG
jgi:RNA polymerase sigma-70 factor (ECF subfamily)